MTKVQINRKLPHDPTKQLFSNAFKLAEEEKQNEALKKSKAVATKQPIDFTILHQILKSSGVDEYDPQVVPQLYEFVHRYVTDVLTDAQEYSAYASKTAIDQDDAKLAIESRLAQEHTEPPSRELLLELAEKRNRVPLPLIPNSFGVHLPPADEQLATGNIVISTFSEAAGSTSKTPSMSSSLPSKSSAKPKTGARNKTIASHQIPIQLSSKVDPKRKASNISK